MAKVPDRKPKLTDEERHKRFVEVARKVEADETEEGADRALRRVVRPRDANNPDSSGRRNRSD
jgi:hypothetical protein